MVEVGEDCEGSLLIVLDLLRSTLGRKSDTRTKNAGTVALGLLLDLRGTEIRARWIYI